MTLYFVQDRIHRDPDQEKVHEREISNLQKTSNPKPGRTCKQHLLSPSCLTEKRLTESVSMPKAFIWIGHIAVSTSLSNAKSWKQEAWSVLEKGAPRVSGGLCLWQWAQAASVYDDGGDCRKSGNMLDAGLGARPKAYLIVFGEEALQDTSYNHVRQFCTKR